MIASLMAIVNPGEEVIVFEPFYENYGPDSILCGAQPRFITLHEPDWHFDRQELAQAFNNRTKAIVLNTPNNPTGKVFSREELQDIADLCLKWNVIAVTDEIYEHILYDGTHHVSLASLPGMRDRTITINSISKTYSLTGWRVGWAIASPALTASIRKVHDFLTVGAPHPLQEAAAAALQMDRHYYQSLAEDYRERRDFLGHVLEETGFRVYWPRGAYYIMTDVGHWGIRDGISFAHHLVETIGVATVPGSSFYSQPSLGATKVRFCFPKKNGDAGAGRREAEEVQEIGPSKQRHREYAPLCLLDCTNLKLTCYAHLVSLQGKKPDFRALTVCAVRYAVLLCLLQAAVRCFPFDVFEEGGNIIGSLQPVIDHKGMLKDIENQQGVAACGMAHIVFINPLVE